MGGERVSLPSTACRLRRQTPLLSAVQGQGQVQGQVQGLGQVQGQGQRRGSEQGLGQR